MSTPTAPTPAAAIPLLWFTSGSRAKNGQTHCAWARWMSHHAGPHGTGYKRIQQAIPLATGAAVHTGIELIGGWVLDYQNAHGGQPPAEGIVPAEVIAWAALEAAARYEIRARKKGFVEMDEQAAAVVDKLIIEQRTLVEAQVWLWATVRLPNLLTVFRFLNVEHPEHLVIGCTCGLGDGAIDLALHVARGCQGIVEQGKADVLFEGIEAPHAIVYVDIKTKAYENYGWEQAWFHSPQVFTNMEAASLRLGREIKEAFIDVLFKGKFGRDQYDPPEVPKYQHSPLVVGYFDAGNLPMREPNWSSRYKWYDDYGKGHTLGKVYTKRSVWDEEYPMPPTRPGASRVETWVMNYIVPVQYKGLMKVIGPVPRPVGRTFQMIQARAAEENRWRADVAAIRAGEAAAEDLIARSYDCTFYNGAPCDFKRLCDWEPGWEDPLSTGRYEIRTPHHPLERAAFEAQGVVFPETTDEDEESYDADAE